MLELYLIGGGAAALVTLALLWKRSIRRKAQKELEAKIATENLEKFKNEAKKQSEVERPADAVSARKWLRNRNKNRRG